MLFFFCCRRAGGDHLAGLGRVGGPAEGGRRDQAALRSPCQPAARQSVVVPRGEFRNDSRDKEDVLCWALFQGGVKGN